MKKLSVFITAIVLLVLAGPTFAQENVGQMVISPPTLPTNVPTLGQRAPVENNFGDDPRARFYEEVLPCRLYDTRNPSVGFLKNSANLTARDLRTIEVSNSAPCFNRVPKNALEVNVRVWTIGRAPSNEMEIGFVYFTTPSSLSQGGEKIFSGWDVAPFAYSRASTLEFYDGRVQLKSQPGEYYKGSYGKLVLEVYAEYDNPEIVVDLIGFTTLRPQ